jgi:two-component system NarL family sensor kinase
VLSRDGNGRIADHGGVTSSAVILRAPRATTRLVDAAVAVAGLVLAGALATGVALHAANAGNPLAPGVTDWWVMPVVGGVAFGGAGLWLARARPRLPMGWLLAAIGAVLATSSAALEYGVHALGRGGGGVLPVSAFWFANWAWSTALVTVGTVVPLVLPEGRLPSRRWRPALVLAVLAVVLVTVAWALTPYGSWSPPLRRAGVVNPVGVDWVTSPAAGVVQLVVALAAVATSLASLVVRWCTAGPEGRQQLKWLGLGAVAGLLLFFLGLVAGPLITALALVPLPVACLVAALRHGLWDVDVVISRSLVYAALMAVVLALYAGVVALLGGVLGATTGAPVVAAAVVAVLALPLHRRLAELVNRLVHGEPEEPFAVLRRLGDRLAAAQDDETLAEQVLPDVVAALARAMRLPYVAVQLADGTEVARGRCPADVAQLPLVYAGADVGRLVVAARHDGRTGAARTVRDAKVLAALAEQTAVAVHTVVLARDVRRSRELAVTAREEERRRLYRDLHDGLGPALAALALQVETARDLVAVDADRAGRLLGQVGAHLKDTVGEVRTVVHGLRPPALDDLGLADALRELAGRFDGSLSIDMTVDVRADAGSELPAAVEVAAYAITGEALANVARHAGARTAWLRLEREGGWLVVTVTDDGRGIPPDARPGVGLVSMRRRAEELGGTVEVAAAGDRAGDQLVDAGAGRARRGTAVTARLPLELR